MGSVAEASTLFRDIAGPQRLGHSVKAALRSLHGRFPWLSANRVRDIYYSRDGIRISAEEMDAFRAEKIRKETEDAKRKLQEALTILRRGEAALRISDPDYYSDYFDRLGDMAGSEDSPMAKRDGGE